MTAERPEHRLRCTCRHRLNLEREEKDEGERRQHDHPLQRGLEDRYIEGRRAADDECDNTCYDKADAHVVVDAQHVLAKTLVKECLGANGRAVALIDRVHTDLLD